ncbi:metal ABC transporter ATP-binding protein [Halobacillus locisalis]|uniref:Metal ABC transporter ATP-binding protein n=1 Tax=Halobacillus locisalis TaxID=220753 RepID=A0A838CVM0_9BACI|nr:metal ABC transporter ATP-binding protein [Halobacillus locisalis]MBA2176020.1 metal ABC transporter ATP-binding protein [Halobacillus locisalis]
MTQTAISIEDLHVSYFGNEAIRHVSLNVEPGNLVGIIGPNGAGKSTLLKAMLGLIPRDKGQVKILDKPVKEVRKQIAYVPQRNDIDWDFPITVLDAVLLGTYPRLKRFRRPGKKERQWALECLARVGMDAFSKRQIGELSGGQQQRVFLARALAQQADVFFLDEPFVGVDASSEETIVKILKELGEQGKTVVVVHHDLSKANEYFNQLILLNKELIGFGTVGDVLQSKVIERAYQGQFAFMNGMGV